MDLRWLLSPIVCLYEYEWVVTRNSSGVSPRRFLKSTRFTRSLSWSFSWSFRTWPRRFRLQSETLFIPLVGLLGRGQGGYTIIHFSFQPPLETGVSSSYASFLVYVSRSTLGPHGIFYACAGFEVLKTFERCSQFLYVMCVDNILIIAILCNKNCYTIVVKFFLIVIEFSD